MEIELSNHKVVCGIRNSSCSTRYSACGMHLRLIMERSMLMQLNEILCPALSTPNDSQSLHAQPRREEKTNKLVTLPLPRPFAFASPSLFGCGKCYVDIFPACLSNRNGLWWFERQTSDNEKANGKIKKRAKVWLSSSNFEWFCISIRCKHVLFIVSPLWRWIE